MLSLPRTRSLRIAEHTVHRCDPSDGDTEYVISTLKDFLLRVELCEHGVRVETHEPMPLNLHLVYESGKDVEQIGDVPLMTGADGLLDQGVAAFKLKVSALSSLRQQQRFRISIRVFRKQSDLSSDTSEQLHERQWQQQQKEEEIQRR